MKKFFRGALATLMAVAGCFSLVGCGGDDDTVNDVVDLEIDTSITATISVGIQQSASEEAIVRAFIDEFNKTYPNVTVNIVQLEGNYMSALMARVRADNVPDVIWVRDEDVSYFAANDFLQNLDAYMEASNFDETQYYESMMNLGKLNQSGSQYMLPRDYNKVVVYYNKDLFAQAGITEGSDLYPSDDWTYEEFLATCKALKSGLPNGVYPVDAMLTWAPIYNTYIRAYGGYIMNENGMPAFDSAEAKAGLDAMAYLYDSKYTINPANKTEDLFLSSKSAMWFSTRPSISNIEAQGLSYDVVSFPYIGETGYVGAGASGYSLYAKGKNKNVAYLFLESMLSKESQEAFSKTGNAVPVRLDLKETGKWLETPNDINFFNHYAFTKNPERDCLTDYLNNVNVDYHADVKNAINLLLDEYMGWSDSSTASNKTAVINEVKTDIIRILTYD